MCEFIKIVTFHLKVLTISDKCQSGVANDEWQQTATQTGRFIIQSESVRIQQSHPHCLHHSLSLCFLSVSPCLWVCFGWSMCGFGRAWLTSALRLLIWNTCDQSAHQRLLKTQYKKKQPGSPLQKSSVCLRSVVKHLFWCLFCSELILSLCFGPAFSFCLEGDSALAPCGSSRRLPPDLPRSHPGSTPRHSGTTAPPPGSLHRVNNSPLVLNTTCCPSLKSAFWVQLKTLTPNSHFCCFFLQSQTPRPLTNWSIVWLVMGKSHFQNSSSQPMRVKHDPYPEAQFCEPIKFRHEGHFFFHFWWKLQSFLWTTHVSWLLLMNDGW